MSTETGGVDLELLSLRTSSAEEERRSGEGTGCLTAEVFSPGRFGTLAFDLLNGWDLSRPEDQAEATKIILRDKPALVVGSPPCTMVLPT